MMCSFLVRDQSRGDMSAIEVYIILFRGEANPEQLVGHSGSEKVPRCYFNLNPLFDKFTPLITLIPLSLKINIPTPPHTGLPGCMRPYRPHEQCSAVRGPLWGVDNLTLISFSLNLPHSYFNVNRLFVKFTSPISPPRFPLRKGRKIIFYSKMLKNGPF